MARYFPLDVPETVAVHGKRVVVKPAAPAPVSIEERRGRGRRAMADLYGGVAD